MSNLKIVEILPSKYFGNINALCFLWNKIIDQDMDISQIVEIIIKSS